MGGTREGGIQAAKKNLALNPNHYKEIGHLGGSAPKTKPHGFAAMNKRKLRAAQRKGGSRSRRTYTPEQLQKTSERSKRYHAQKKLNVEA